MAVQQVSTRLILDGSITNAKVAASAGIVYSKLNLTGGIVNADINASAAIDYSKLNLTNSIINADINASAAIAYSKLNLSGSIVNADINASAAIAYSKLNLSGSIVNADVSASAAIDYSKLNLANSIVNADISASAAIAYSKLSLSNSITNTDINASAGIVYSKLNLTGGIVNADINASAAIAYSKLNLTNSILDADVNASADISTSKLSLFTDFRHVVPNEVFGYTPDTSALIQDVSGDIVGTISTGPTVKGIVVLEADQNFVPRGIQNEYSLDDITSGDINTSLTGEDANQSVYMRLTNSRATSQPVNITGVTIGYVEEGNTSGTLDYVDATNTLTWKAGTGVVVSANGLYILDDGAGSRIVVEVVFASLPGTDQNDSISFTSGLRGGLFYRRTTDGEELPLKTPASLPDPWRLKYSKIHGIDDLPYTAFFGIGNSTDGVITSQHVHTLSSITDVTATASELNQALTGISANVTATNLNTLTAGPASNADALHTHSSLALPDHQIDVFVATNGQTIFTLSQTPNTDSEHITIEGVKQAKTTHYTVSGTTLTLNEGALAGERVVAQYMY